MPRFKLTIEYAGTRYSGWQIQTNARTVQGEIAQAVRVVTGRGPDEFYGSGRTDAGVHALAQVAHLGVATSLPPAAIRHRLNEELPSDIVILDVETVDHRFHARKSALGRAYLYQVARRRTAFAKPYVWWVRDPLDLDRVRLAAAHVTGLHDFRSFTDDDPEEKSTRVHLERVEVAEHGHLVLVRFIGSHFLWKMVRRLVGVFVEIGRGGLAPEAVDDLLRERSSLAARLTAPSSGLFLERVFYRGDPRDHPLRPALGG